MTYKSFACFALCGLFTISCSHFTRSNESGYQQSESYSSGTGGGTGSPSRDYNRDRESRKTAYELGLDPTSLSADDQVRIQERLRLRSLEKTLGSQKEREQYSKILPWLKGDHEKIEFLSVPSIEGRQQWVNNRGIWDRSRVPMNEMKDLIEAQDISVGMQQDYVRRAWGDPQNVEVSGNPIYKNERWRYQRFISSPDGYKKETRFVYFEGGRVVGWETE